MTFVAVADKSAGDPVLEAMWDAIKTDINEGVWRPLAETRLSGSTASIDIQNIPQTHSGFMIVVHSRQVSASATVLRIRFNNDSAGNYDYQYNEATAATRVAAEAFAATAILIGEDADSTSAAGNYGQAVVWVPNYANATTHKSCTAQSTVRRATASGGTRFVFSSGVWRSTAAITRVTAFNTVNLDTGSRMTIYGTGAGV